MRALAPERERIMSKKGKLRGYKRWPKAQAEAQALGSDAVVRVQGLEDDLYIVGDYASYAAITLINAGDGQHRGWVGLGHLARLGNANGAIKPQELTEDLALLKKELRAIRVVLSDGSLPPMQRAQRAIFRLGELEKEIARAEAATMIGAGPWLATDAMRHDHKAEQEALRLAREGAEDE